MTPKAQQIAIAEACGWVFAEMCPWAPWVGPDNRNYKSPPDYLSDLNAMHEAEKVLTGAFETCSDYQKQLIKVCGCEGYLPSAQFLWHATAAQRAEAFLRTLNLWDDSK
jgi:hypothetical protein